MLQKTEVRQAEPKIRRMEYRAAHAPLPASPPNLSFPLSSLFAQEASPAKPQEEQPEQIEAVRAEDRMREMEQQMLEREEGFAHQLEAARKEAFALGRQESESAREATLQNMRSVLERAVSSFRDARDAYLAQVEQEVVRLALGIAARVLNREAQMDPLLLSGAVRVALGQLSDTTEVRLRVPAAEFALWDEMVRLMPSLPLHPQLVADDLLGPAECALETHLGSVDLGVRAQLAEIERGFFDLLERRGVEHRDETVSANERKQA
jgi:flagellar assembly protein FliH